MSHGLPALFDRSITQLESLAALLTEEARQPCNRPPPPPARHLRKEALLTIYVLLGPARPRGSSPGPAATHTMYQLRRMSTGVQYRTVPARIQAYIDCPKCGRISKAEAEIMVVPRSGGPNHIHCHLQCERCGSRKALLHIEREILSRH